MNLLNKSWHKIVFCSLFFMQLNIQARHTEAAFEDDFDFSGISMEELAAFEQANPPDYSTIRILPASDLAQLLLKANINAPLWNSTAVPAGRDILYHFPYSRVTGVEYGGISCNFFFNMTNQMQVTAGDVFNFENLTDIHDFIEGVSEQDFEQLLPLFKKITLQERKAGFFIQGGFLQGPFTVQLHTSLQMGERNFWLNERDVRAIKALFGEEFSNAEFDDHELYKIRYGMGDTRIKLGLNTINMTSFQIDLGFEGILPTSRLSYTPALRLGVVQAPFTEEESLQKNGVMALKAIRDNLLNPRLGNDGHFGFGCYIESRVGIFHDMAQLLVRASYDHLFPGDEDRLFLFNQTVTNADLETVTGNTPRDQEIVNDFIRQNIFPSSFKSKVYPGGVTNIVFAINANITKRWRGALGYDFYAKKKEHIKNIYNSTIELEALNLKIAESPAAVQHKIFSELFYHNKKETVDTGVGMGGDITISNIGIGADWTVYLKAASSF